MTDHGDGSVQAYTVRLELADEPGELLAALEPIAARGGNLLSVFHERGSLTPRGHIPVEVDLECPPDRFDAIVSALRDASVNVTRAGAERYDEEVTVLLTGAVLEADVSGTVARIEDETGASVVDLSISAPAGEPASARLRLATASDRVDDVLASLRSVAAEKELCLVEPLTEVEA
ncbi:amino acid-binding protein [Halomicrococcus sp. NG-SE-24]|uniref:amino acid-binding protein n=1 Tax=unclassified Halomicrococcus TaxID=2614448 RepID=UPI000DE03239|nr:amino acid-binding protein [halophilic archaeon]